MRLSVNYICVYNNNIVGWKLYLKKQRVVMTPFASWPKERQEATEHMIIMIKVTPYTFSVQVCHRAIRRRVDQKEFYKGPHRWPRPQHEGAVSQASLTSGWSSKCGQGAWSPRTRKKDYLFFFLFVKMVLNYLLSLFMLPMYIPHACTTCLYILK